MTVKELKEVLKNIEDENMEVEVAYEGISGSANCAYVWEGVFVISE